MAKHVTGIKGEFRRLTPVEIGAIVRASREQQQLKRISLAEAAHLSEKTLERIEGGKAAGPRSYRGIAKALGLHAEVLTRHQYVPTETEVRDSVERYAARIQQENEEVPVQAITDPRDMLAILEADAFILDDAEIATKHAEKTAALHELFADAASVLDELPATDRLKLGRQLLEELRAIERLGYFANRTVQSVLRGKPPYETSIMAIKFWRVRAGRTEPSSVWLPKRVAS